MANTSAPTGGSVTSGLPMNRNNQDNPDFEQEKREQARNESKWAAGELADHPPFTRVGPDAQAALDAEA